MEEKNKDLELFDEIEFEKNVAAFREIKESKSNQGQDVILEFEKELNKDLLNYVSKNKDLKTTKYKKAKK